MGMETLNSAARAAGFAMAASDEPINQADAEPKAARQSWKAGEAMLLQASAQPKASASSTDWLKSLLGLFGRGAPA
jgi:hypothetical protein